MLIYRALLVVVSIFILAITAEESDESSNACIDLLESEEQTDCCESLSMLEPFEEFDEECISKKDSKEYTCADYTCVLNKMGLMKNDKIDEDAGLKLLSNMDKQFPGEKDVVSSIRSSCFDGKYEDYEFDDEHCPAMNFYICAYITTLQNCKSWKTTVVCQKMAADMKKCIAQLEDS